MHKIPRFRELTRKSSSVWIARKNPENSLRENAPIKQKNLGKEKNNEITPPPRKKKKTGKEWQSTRKNPNVNKKRMRFFAYSWKFPAYGGIFLLTIDNFGFVYLQLEFFFYLQF